ncbi:MAG: glycosyltransferase, partial [Pseudomonadota bacterium]
IALLSLAVLGIWAGLYWGRGGFWRADQRLSDAENPQAWPSVVIVIPARDEAPTIADVIAAHMACDYEGPLAIVLIDDQSSDGTAEKARTAARQAASVDDGAFEEFPHIAAAARADKERPLFIFQGTELPKGWSGKLWAVNQGVQRAAEIAPEAAFVLLTDADIVLAKDSLRRLVAKAESENLALASLMARLDARGAWGALLIPAFIYFFQQLFPFPRVNDPRDDTAAAAGGCVLVRANALRASGGIAKIRGSLIDDCALARRIKDVSPTTTIWLGLADDEAISLRDNHALKDIWTMVARTAYAQLRYSPVLLAGTVLGMALIYLAPVVLMVSALVGGNIIAFVAALAASGLMAKTYLPTLKLYDRDLWEAALLPIAATLYTAMTISSALRHWRGRGGTWKGRTYS